MTPGSIVKVTLLFTSTGAVSMYGLFACVQVVSERITPETSVEAFTVPKRTALAKINPHIRMAVKNAIIMKDKHPETDIYILYRDIRTYGLLEEHYRKAREKGVRFIRYEEDKKPEVSANNGGFKVSCVDPVLNGSG